MKFKPIFKMLLGVVVILLGVYLTVQYFPALKQIVKGCLGPFLIFVGLIMAAIAKG